ncbi:MAG: hypothetical protein AABY84_11435 [Candidatus Firestonebacteria bacterium]
MLRQCISFIAVFWMFIGYSNAQVKEDIFVDKCRDGWNMIDSKWTSRSVVVNNEVTYKGSTSSIKVVCEKGGNVWGGLMLLDSTKKNPIYITKNLLKNGYLEFYINAEELIPAKNITVLLKSQIGTKEESAGDEYRVMISKYLKEGEIDKDIKTWQYVCIPIADLIDEDLKWQDFTKIMILTPTIDTPIYFADIAIVEK